MAEKTTAKTQPEDAKAPEVHRTFEETHAETIRTKVRAGLSVEQAIEVTRNQVAHDLALKAEEDRKAKSAEEAKRKP